MAAQIKTAPRARWLPGLLLYVGVRLAAAAAKLCVVVSKTETTTVPSVHAVLLLLVDLIGSEGGLGEAVVVPPVDECCHGGATSSDSLLQLGAVNGQDGLAAGAEDLVCQGQACLLYTSDAADDLNPCRSRWSPEH